MEITDDAPPECKLFYRKRVKYPLPISSQEEKKTCESFLSKDNRLHFSRFIDRGYSQGYLKAQYIVLFFNRLNTIMMQSIDRISS